MSASADLFTPAAPLQVDLRSSHAWEPWVQSPTVHLSYCGRYSIVRNEEPRRKYLAFLRNGSTENRDWKPPVLLGAFVTPGAARGACADHAEGSR